MKTWLYGALLGAALLSAAPAAAGPVLELNGARANGRWGAELGAGYGIGAAGFTLRPMVGAFLYRGNNDRYRQDSLGNGQSRCRDLTNGQFARDSLCDNLAAKPYARIEASYAIPMLAEIGGGVRFSTGKVRPYGTAAFPLAPMLKLKANGGPHYAAAGLSLRF